MSGQAIQLLATLDFTLHITMALAFLSICLVAVTSLLAVLVLELAWLAVSLLPATQQTNDQAPVYSLHRCGMGPLRSSTMRIRCTKLVLVSITHTQHTKSGLIAPET